MRRYHWSFYFAISYLILIFIINLCISFWASSEYSRLTQDFNSSSQEAAPTIIKRIDGLFDSLLNSLEDTNTDNDPNKIKVNGEEIQKKSAELVNTAKSALVHMLISVFASVLTTVALIFPKLVMNIIEKLIWLPDIDYESLSIFKFVMVLANISILCWDIYGAASMLKFF